MKYYFDVSVSPDGTVATEMKRFILTDEDDYDFIIFLLRMLTKSRDEKEEEFRKWIMSKVVPGEL